MHYIIPSPTFSFFFRSFISRTRDLIPFESFPKQSSRNVKLTDYERRKVEQLFIEQFHRPHNNFRDFPWKKPDEINLTRILSSFSSSLCRRLIALESAYENFNTIAAFLHAKQGKLFRYSARNICPPVDRIAFVFFPVFFRISSSLDRWKIV